MRLTLRARWVVPISSPAVEGGWVHIRGGRIAAVGRGSPPSPCVDLGDAVILPGLVNAHTHLEFSGLSHPLDPADGHDGLPGWIRAVVASRRGRSRPDADAAILAGLAESAASGVTTIGEIATGLAAAHLRGTGPRLRLFREAIAVDAARVEAVTRGVNVDLDRLRRHGVLSGVSPHAPYSVDGALGRDLLQAAARRGVPAAMHLAESPDEDAFVASGSGRWRDLLVELGAWPEGRSPRLLSVSEWIGRLSRCDRSLVVHATYLDDAALARLARHARRIAVAVCPRTTLRLAGRLPPVARLRAAGIRVAIGTDGRGSNPDLSVLGECAALAGAGVVSPAEAIAMATREGGWALGLERVAGGIAPGRPADLAIVAIGRGFGNPFDAAIDPAHRVVATLRRGRPIFQSPGGVPIEEFTAGSS